QLAIIFLSDEDERSTGGDDLITQETPARFLSDVQQMYPNKSIKTHSIIIRPGDNSCLTEQMVGLRGFYGDVYAELTNLTGGVLGNICADNYTDQLGAIGEDVAQPRQILPCQPLNDDVTVSFSPEPPYYVEVTQNLEQREILFSRSLPKDTKIRFQFQCNN
ncbi:MAG: hypothetical protein HRT44_12735, partial [Bdellovibrionales bacterium]|nr:hypothetical protein [Bdellovibrionales bacterium]NQZ20103.1 hypothetical protein [Bdellovibrionales bacterium]